MEFSLEAGGFLTALFSVQSARSSYLNTALSADKSQWGLWDWDVVELFVSCAGRLDHLPYYEFQVSPLGQFFELEIFEPRKKVNRDFSSGFAHSVRSQGPGKWEASLRIPLAQLGWDGRTESIVGNAFAILGAPSEVPSDRTYRSLFLGHQEKPDFHVPAAFRRLL